MISGNYGTAQPSSAAGRIGDSVRRVEDAPLITGAGHYVDDVQLPGMLHMAVLRSPYPHARVLAIDTSTAQDMPGVKAVLTGADVEERLNIRAPVMTPGMKVPPHPVLARGSVHAVGVPIAVVAAETLAQAQDAVDAIQVEYEPLPSVADAEAALEADAPLAREELDSNVCYTLRRDGGDVDAAFAAADHVTRLHIRSPRQVAMSLEPRGVVASPDPMGAGLTVWLSTQGPHRVRADLATTLGFPENRIRLIAPDVGGGFGSKGPLYREDVLVSLLALKLGRPVKWIASRREDIVTTIQGRDQSMTSELALSRDGTMLGLKVRVVANLGAYLQSSTAGPPQRMMVMAPGCYQIRNVRVEIVAVFTNTVPTGPYRGAGRPEAVLNIERMADQAARELGIDRLELRRKNFIQPEQFPYKTATGVEYDSGDYERALDEALNLSHYDDLIRRRDEARARGELAGIGVSTFVEPSGGAGFESGTIRVERTGEITVLTGSSSHGQGHETVFAQVVGEKLGLPLDRIVVRHGDTVAVQQGTGTFGSRSAIMGGGALSTAADRVIEKARGIAALLLDTAAEEEEIVQTEGGFAVAGSPERTVNWRQVAAAAYAGRVPPGEEPGLQATAFFDPKREAWGFGAHVAMIRIDRDTGAPTLDTLVLVDDCGVIINPMIVEGQIHGGVAQGLGEAFREQMLFDKDGTVLTGTLMDYAVMRAADMPPLVLGETVTPNPFNPLGVKGVGEAGTNGAPPAVANAVMDALAPLGITHVDMPYTAPKLWAAIKAATGSASTPPTL
ncbi:MAG: aerobic carbon-monoxide dehydrogenase large subunit [Chloroflexota bacterium]|jgi:carbon-monoxide dehydrogenase large subunit|nr:aerobic carbon-monoxide dehydrogenase large subunit [Chloroflexota bacterium]